MYIGRRNKCSFVFVFVVALTLLSSLSPCACVCLYVCRAEVGKAPYLCGLVAMVAGQQTAAAVMATWSAPTLLPLALWPRMAASHGAPRNALLYWQSPPAVGRGDRDRVCTCVCAGAVKVASFMCGV